MKIGGVSIRMRSMYVMLALQLGSPLSLNAQSDQIVFSFDSIFPTTPYKDALGSCMQALSYLDQLCYEYEQGDSPNVALVHDAFLGKVVSAQEKITYLIADMHAGRVIALDNMHYLNTVLNHIGQMYHKYIKEDQRNMIASRILENMSLQLSSHSES